MYPKASRCEVNICRRNPRIILKDNLLFHSRFSAKTMSLLRLIRRNVYHTPGLKSVPKGWHIPLVIWGSTPPPSPRPTPISGFRSVKRVRVVERVDGACTNPSQSLELTQLLNSNLNETLVTTMTLSVHCHLQQRVWGLVSCPPREVCTWHPRRLLSDSCIGPSLCVSTPPMKPRFHYIWRHPTRFWHRPYQTWS